MSDLVITSYIPCYPTFENIWDILNELAPYSLDGKCQINWRDCIMYIGETIALIGLAHSFFTGAFFATLGYGLLGLISLFGMYYVRKYPTLIQLQEVVINLRDMRISLERNITGLHSTNEQLTENNTHFLENITQLERQNEQLRANIHTLTEVNTRFSGNITELERQIDDMRNVHEHIDQDLQRLKTVREALNQETNSLEEVRRLIQIEQTHLTNIRQQLQAVTNHLTQQSQTLAHQIGHITTPLPVGQIPPVQPYPEEVQIVVL